MEQLIGCLFWLAVYFAGTLLFGQSVAAEREAGCWDGLLLYPVASETIYVAKLIVNILALTAVEVRSHSALFSVGRRSPARSPVAYRPCRILGKRRNRFDRDPGQRLVVRIAARR